ncbi:MAG: endopeptidase La [Candidatus Eisenbacteria bacterium]|nr:endopeptidase La [Candidatus Eisenbacteria bacterium]
MQPEEIKLETIPTQLPILPLRNTLAYPFMVLPLAVGIPRSIKLIEDALQSDKLVGLVGMSDGSIEEPTSDQVWTTGTVARIHRVIRTDENMQVIAQGIERFRIAEWLDPSPYLRARINLAPDIVNPDMELQAAERSLRELTREVVALSPHLPDEVNRFLSQVEEVRHLVYVVASNARLKKEEGQAILEADDVKDKFRLLIKHLSREKELLTLEHKIQSEAHEEMEKAQREFFLRQQLRAIRKELGEEEEADAVADEYREKIEASGMPEEAKKEANRELKRLENMPPQAAEHSVIKTYLDWLVELPWVKRSEDLLDIERARAILNEDHYDLQNVKDRILEYLAVRKLVKERTPVKKPAPPSSVPGTANAAKGDPEPPTGVGTILCFAGPPGVGKTSLGQSIARSLGRKFTRMSLGGMRDEAEIRGHRRTYVGALPGRVIQGIKRAGTRNPVFMLDEVDKLGSDWRGDPSSALLEVLDPVQNRAFRDYYLDVDFDLSEVIFIATANHLETIPGPLRDRMEVIQLEGYTEHEKLQIATNYLVPRQLKQNGLTPRDVVFNRAALQKVIRDYTREAGVRDLERQIGTLCRKAAVEIAGGATKKQTVTPEVVRIGLKRERFESEDSDKKPVPGVSTGLAVTTGGGDILHIEATGMRGKGDLTLTGQLGDVMRESAKIAHSWVRSNAGLFKIDPELFARTDIHVHVPAGAVPKDGPSAGVAMVTAMVSLLTGQPARPGVGMTGEVTLRGRVLPVGGVKMKVLAAHRAGLKTVVLPKRNEVDLDELPDEVKKQMNFVPVDQIEDGLRITMPDSLGLGGMKPPTSGVRAEVESAAKAERAARLEKAEKAARAISAARNRKARSAGKAASTPRGPAASVRKAPASRSRPSTLRN